LRCFTADDYPYPVSGDFLSLGGLRHFAHRFGAFDILPIPLYVFIFKGAMVALENLWSFLLCTKGKEI